MRDDVLADALSLSLHSNWQSFLQRQCNVWLQTWSMQPENTKRFEDANSRTKEGEVGERERERNWQRHFGIRKRPRKHNKAQSWLKRNVPTTCRCWQPRDLWCIRATSLQHKSKETNMKSNWHLRQNYPKNMKRVVRVADVVSQKSAQGKCSPNLHWFSNLSLRCDYEA